MQSIHALSLTANARDWLANSSQPRILHVFDQACNLINERGEVLSIVTSEIGDGPFNLVIPGLRKSFGGFSSEDGLRQTSEVFSDHLHAESPISIRANQLNLGNLTIDTSNARLWSPCPDWEVLHAKRDDILNPIMSLRGRRSPARSNLLADLEIASSQRASTLLATTLPITNYQPLLPSSLLSTLSAALATADISSALIITSQLAGLGNGLTPAGDDFLLGAIYAAWIIHPPEVSRVLAQEIANTAAPLTTSLSAAWLRAGSRGEASAMWHDFFNALLMADSSTIQLQIVKLLSVGHTSGRDALAGFLGSFAAWSNRKG